MSLSSKSTAYQYSQEHELKCAQEHYIRIISGQKTFEIRKNDRNFQVGDILILREYDAKRGQYIDCSPAIRARIVYITHYAQKDDFVVLGIAIEENPDGK
jgi:hypothetical protein